MTKIILSTDPESAVYETRELTGWWSRNGDFTGTSEDYARRLGSTHIQCDNPNHEPYSRNSYCRACSEERQQKRYYDATPTEWDGKSYVYSHSHDMYFADSGDVADFCENNEIDESELELVFTEPVKLIQVDEDYFSDELAEDQDLPPEIQDALDCLNEAIRKYNKEHGGVSVSADYSRKVKNYV